MKVNVLSRVGILSSHQFLSNPDEIENLLVKLGYRNCSILPDGTVNSKGDIEIIDDLIGDDGYFLVKFGDVEGKFFCIQQQKLKFLEGSPKNVGGNFDCRSCNGLTSLQGSPQKVGGVFYCGWCKNLSSFEGCPKTLKSLVCNDCPKLTSLEGSPEKLTRGIFCDYQLSKEAVEKYGSKKVAVND